MFSFHGWRENMLIYFVFIENLQFTIVFKQIFLKIVNLLSYLNSFF